MSVYVILIGVVAVILILAIALGIGFFVIPRKETKRSAPEIGGSKETRRSAPGIGGSQESEPDLGDETATRLRRELAEGTFEGAHALLSQLQHHDQRWFYFHALSDWPGRPAWIDAWVGRYPTSEIPLIMRAAHSIVWAWEARGVGVGSTVSDQAAHLFLQRLQDAVHDCERATQLAPNDPTPWALRIIAARGLSYEKETSAALYREAVRRDPFNRAAHEHTLILLCEKWQGSHREMFDFARTMAARTPDGGSLWALIPLAHAERWLYHLMQNQAAEAEAYFGRAEVRDEIVAAYNRYKAGGDSRGPEAWWAKNLFAYCLAKCGEKKLALPLLGEVQGHLTELPWGYWGNKPSTAISARSAGSRSPSVTNHNY